VIRPVQCAGMAACRYARRRNGEDPNTGHRRRPSLEAQRIVVGPKFNFLEKKLLETFGDGLIFSPNTTFLER